MLVPNPTDTKGIDQTIESISATVFPVVPTMLVVHQRLPVSPISNLRSIRVCLCAGRCVGAAVQHLHPTHRWRPVEAVRVDRGRP